MASFDYTSMRYMMRAMRAAAMAMTTDTTALTMAINTATVMMATACEINKCFHAK